MRKAIILLVFIPMLVQSQSTDNWLTPFADAKFENGKIVYAYNASPDMAICKIKPSYFSQSLMKLEPGLNMPALNPEDVNRQQVSIREYLNSTSAEKLKPDLQEEYIRLAAMVLIWDLKLDKHTLLELKGVNNSENSKVRNNTNLVLKLEGVYQSLK